MTRPTLHEALETLVKEMRAACEELRVGALSPSISAEQAAVLGAPGRVVRSWADRIAAILAAHPEPESPDTTKRPIVTVTPP